MRFVVQWEPLLDWRGVTQMETRICKCGCGEKFTPNRPWQEFVNKQHQQAWNRARYREMEAQEQGDDQRVAVGQ